VLVVPILCVSGRKSHAVGLVGVQMNHSRNQRASTGGGSASGGADTSLPLSPSGLANLCREDTMESKPCACEAAGCDHEKMLGRVAPVIRHATLEHGGTAYVSVGGSTVCLALNVTGCTTYHHLSVADARSLSGLLSIPECYKPEDSAAYIEARRALAPTTTDGESHLSDGVQS
jgi:hypothetical protein